MQHGGPEPLRIPSSINNAVGLVMNKHDGIGMLQVYHMTPDDGSRMKCAHVNLTFGGGLIVGSLRCLSLRNFWTLDLQTRRFRN